MTLLIIQYCNTDNVSYIIDDRRMEDTKLYLEIDVETGKILNWDKESKRIIESKEWEEF